MRWRRTSRRRLRDCRIFQLDEVRYEPPDGGDGGDFYILDTPDWINVIPVTEGGDVVLVRQFRFGIDTTTVEIPGGMCDDDEEPEVAARRELLEETGYEAAEWTELGWVHPNPPVQTNRCFTFLARGVRRVAEQRLDGHERIEVLTRPLGAIPGMIAGGEISHALVVAAFQLLANRRDRS